MIALEKFLECVQKNADRVSEYRLGGDGADGTCDCIGLIIGAIKLAGGSWTGVHGSNWAARNAVNDLHKVTKSSQLVLGDIVFKTKSPGESGYALPSRYISSGDLLDYYHVGVVTNVDPLCITHCTSVVGGIKRDSSIGTWAYAGQLKCVDYGGDPVLYSAVVMSKNGKPVNLRKSESTNAKVVEQVPCGEIVDVLEETNATWAKISDHGVTGYMMREFLINESEAPDFIPDTDLGSNYFVISMSDALILRDAINTIQEILNKANWD